MNAQLKPFAEPAEVAPSKTVVLAIEDEAAREAIAAELSAGGFHVIQVEDGYELFDCHHPSLNRRRQKKHQLFQALSPATPPDSPWVKKRHRSELSEK